MSLYFERLPLGNRIRCVILLREKEERKLTRVSLFRKEKSAYLLHSILAGKALLLRLIKIIQLPYTAYGYINCIIPNLQNCTRMNFL